MKSSAYWPSRGAWQFQALWHFAEGLVLGFAVLMETAIAMVLLSRVLKYRANRWANIIAGIIHTAAVFLSLFVGTPALYYIFFATIEIACTLFIVWYAWKWPKQEAWVDFIFSFFGNDSDADYSEDKRWGVKRMEKDFSYRWWSMSPFPLIQLNKFWFKHYALGRYSLYKKF